MSAVRILMDLGLLSWSTLYVGLKRDWAKTQDAVDYAVSILLDGNYDDDISVIASEGFSDKKELYDLIFKKVNGADNSLDFDKWRLAHLIAIDESDFDEQTKLEKLQDIYVEFNYPEDMASCSIYSQDDIDPIECMRRVINTLKIKLML